MGAPIRYEVRPRFTPGSPAQVDEATFWRVRAQEQEGYYRARSGRFGDEERARAERLGLERVAFTRRERGGCWLIGDCMTNRNYLELPDLTLGKGQGFGPGRVVLRPRGRFTFKRGEAPFGCWARGAVTAELAWIERPEHSQAKAKRVAVGDVAVFLVDGGYLRVPVTEMWMVEEKC